MDEREAYIALNMMEKVGPVGVRAMAASGAIARTVAESIPPESSTTAFLIEREYKTRTGGCAAGHPSPVTRHSSLVT